MIIDTNNSLSSAVNTYSSSVTINTQKNTEYISDTDNTIKPLKYSNKLEKTYKLGDLINKINDISEKESVIEKSITDSIEEANRKVIGPNIELNFKVHDKTKRILIKVINQETKEVIREIPPEKLIDIVTDICNPKGKILDIKK